ncbi:hypothetical protein BCV70DRAFT_166387 [Testicularia cyperi]|uniref:DDE Tnp4 domain-containing protein n=1 Tax=Testicularia cyperi TaxID=1882483 RepID=A0A317XJW4_9BASI|nr:hypothetical protein BCV70DRAFT_166387 [Testicularia cyperi]
MELQPLLQLSALASFVASIYYILDVRDTNQLLVLRRCYNDLTEMSDEHFQDNFGINHTEFDQIHKALKLPPLIKTDVQDSEDSCTALLMLLAYLRGRTICGLESQYGWSKSRISRVRAKIVELILQKWGHLLDVRMCGNTLLSKDNLQTYTEQIRSKCGVDLVWGFVDGTLRPVARPTRGQEAVYNGWKHFHALKYQIISTPDGLIFAQGPWDGSENDWSVWKKSGVAEWLQMASQQENNKQLFLFGDKGYHLDSNLIVPYKGNNITAEQTHFNVIMSKYRITVEWAIGSVGVLFPRLNNRQQQKFLLTPVASDYLVGIILCNALSCLKGNTTSQYFELDPPSLEMYFRETDLIPAVA